MPAHSAGLPKAPAPSSAPSSSAAPSSAPSSDGTPLEHRAPRPSVAPGGAAPGILRTGGAGGGSGAPSPPDRRARHSPGRHRANGRGARSPPSSKPPSEEAAADGPAEGAADGAAVAAEGEGGATRAYSRGLAGSAAAAEAVAAQTTGLRSSLEAGDAALLTSQRPRRARANGLRRQSSTNRTPRDPSCNRSEVGECEVACGGKATGDASGGAASAAACEGGESRLWGDGATGAATKEGRRTAGIPTAPLLSGEVSSRQLEECNGLTARGAEDRPTLDMRLRTASTESAGGEGSSLHALITPPVKNTLLAPGTANPPASLSAHTPYPVLPPAAGLVEAAASGASESPVKSGRPLVCRSRRETRFLYSPFLAARPFAIPCRPSILATRGWNPPCPPTPA